MNLDDVRSLRGQIIATLSLFALCVPAAATVICLRPRFESHMYEKFTANYAEFGEPLKALADAADAGLADADAPPRERPQDAARRREMRDEIRRLAPHEKELLFQDWMVRDSALRRRAPRSLVASDAEFFVRRAEQSIVCGDARQRALALDFFARCGASEVQSRLERLADWAHARRWTEAELQIRAALAASE